MRSVFLALPLEGHAKRQFQSLQQALKPWEDILHFQNAQAPHLTLQFWKEVGELELSGIQEQASKIASRAMPFVLRMTGADTFGSTKEGDRVLFLSVEFSPPLALLKKQCPWDTRAPFHPHVTLARICHPQRFAVVKKTIMKELRGIDIPIYVDRLRVYGEIDSHKQTPIVDCVFSSAARRP